MRSLDVNSGDDHIDAKILCVLTPNYGVYNRLYQQTLLRKLPRHCGIKHHIAREHYHSMIVV
jgi:hypothetical protein